MYLCDLPVEIDNEAVSSFFSDYEVLSLSVSQWITAALTISRMCEMVIVLLKSCSPRRFRALSVLKVATTVCATMIRLLNVPFVASVANHAPACPLSLVCANAVVGPAIWPGNKPRRRTLQFLFLPWMRPSSELPASSDRFGCVSCCRLCFFCSAPGPDPVVSVTVTVTNPATVSTVPVSVIVRASTASAPVKNRAGTAIY